MVYEVLLYGVVLYGFENAALPAAHDDHGATNTDGHADADTD